MTHFFGGVMPFKFRDMRIYKCKGVFEYCPMITMHYEVLERDPSDRYETGDIQILPQCLEVDGKYLGITKDLLEFWLEQCEKHWEKIGRFEFKEE
jgi:hypothetical protein